MFIQHAGAENRMIEQDAFPMHVKFGSDASWTQKNLLDLFLDFFVSRPFNQVIIY